MWYDYWRGYSNPTYYSITTDKWNNRIIELKFFRKPDEHTLACLRKNEWKWNGWKCLWYVQYSEKALKFAINECRETVEREQNIKNIPEFYRKHCGLSEQQLVEVSDSIFQQVAKYGTLEEIAISLLVDKLPEQAVALLRDYYMMIVKDEDYREQFIKTIPRHLYYQKANGKLALSDDQRVESPLTLTEEIRNQIGLKQSRFWEELKILVGTPIDRTAYIVSQFHEAHLARCKSTDQTGTHFPMAQYYHAKTRKDYYLYGIIYDLNLTYDDFLTRSIKYHLEKELHSAQPRHGDNYVFALYALLIGQEKKAIEYVEKYVNEFGPEAVILKNEKTVDLWKLRWNS